jgi:hypothetical protein
MMNDILQNWDVIQNGNLWRVDPDNKNIRWHVVKRDNGWFWYIHEFLAVPPSRTSSEFGPFSSWEAAAADCETAHSA